MTREEAIGHIKDVICENNTIKPNMVVFEQEKEALCMAIEALKAEPCEDCVNRKRVKHLIHTLRIPKEYEQPLWDGLDDLPSVTPKPTECENAVDRDTIIREMEKRHKEGDAITIGYIKNLPPVTPKQRLCKDCKFFEYDHVENVDGITLIVAHEVCNRWGNGCQTKEDGYCFLFEPKMEGVSE